MRITPIFVSILLCLGLGLTACGSSEPTTTTTADQEASVGGEAQEHPQLPPDLAAFHDALAPVWHHDPGEERAHDACDAAQTYIQLSANVQNGEDLRTATRHLAAVCGSAETSAIEEALSGVHQAFHDVMEARDGGEVEHDMDGGEGDHDMEGDSEAPSDEAAIDGAEAPPAG